MPSEVGEFRCRMPELRQQEQAIQGELQSLDAAATDQTKYLRLVETLANFRTRLSAHADALDIIERQKILRLLVKEVLVGRDTLTIRHSIRVPQATHPDPDGAPLPPYQSQQPPMAQSGPSYLLRSDRS